VTLTLNAQMTSIIIKWLGMSSHTHESKNASVNDEEQRDGNYT